MLRIGAGSQLFLALDGILPVRDAHFHFVELLQIMPHAFVLKGRASPMAGPKPLFILNQRKIRIRFCTGEVSFTFNIQPTGLYSLQVCNIQCSCGSWFHNNIHREGETSCRNLNLLSAKDASFTGKDDQGKNPHSASKRHEAFVVHSIHQLCCFLLSQMLGNTWHRGS